MTGVGGEQTVVGHLWWSNHLEVTVYDPLLGKTFRIQFTRAVDGLMKNSGGGGCRRNEKGRFDSAKETAADWVRDEIGYGIVDDQTWSRTKDLRGMDFRDRQELRSLSEAERRQLASRLRSGEIELDAGTDESGDGDSGGMDGDRDE